MSDQKKWFKLWTSILSDDDFNPDDHGLLRLGRFCLLGAYLALHGNKGVAVISEKLLLRYTQCDNIDTLRADFMHKNIVFEECKNRHGRITVTFHKWVKYQEDSTQAKRQQVSRSKKRGEEKRGEENKNIIKESHFYEIWGRYFPNYKDGTKMALKHFLASVKTEQDWKDINTALDNYKAHLEKETWKKPKNGSTWFNNWRDWINVERAKAWNE